jgi:phosphoribosylformimino-5-aminoimidazole carboxamide ribotide isomerase
MVTMRPSFHPFPQTGFQIIPAIDLMGGQAVRLWQGDYDTAENVADDPVRVAQTFVQDGARRVHLVDLDGARSGQPVNTDVIEQIVRVADVPVQVGGGLRKREHVQELFDVGVDQVILGTMVMEEFHRFMEWAERWPGRIVVGLDAREGRLAKRGWLVESEQTLFDFALRVAESPIAGIIYTDIQRDGTGRGPNSEQTCELAQSIATVPVVASGGVGRLEHLVDLQKFSATGVVGAIVGKAIYQGAIQLRDAIEHLAGLDTDGGQT